MMENDEYSNKVSLALQKGESVFRFVEVTSMNTPKEYYLLTSELKEKHKDLLLGDMINSFNRLPGELQIKFLDQVLSVVKDNKIKKTLSINCPWEGAGELNLTFLTKEEVEARRNPAYKYLL
jgi:hypothetical protein